MKNIFISLIAFFVYLTVSGQTENPSVFVMNLSEEAMESKTSLKKDEITIDKKII
ncbi:hypothetical protein H9X57_06180 [Flavobacterium piscinae]|uniref:hypothetical protein n=1 Tax=Flavobacterium piscinae TaxID=2506424 RepID=UPI0019985075|nr:hypothetical protein [Flavobacterium piscinae]MBC8883132.1 hypothetical protein [Flavobacterium piscinae]